MAYNQYSIYAYTGNAEAAKNRVSSNSADAINSEDTGYPHRFDLYVNKENASIGGYAVVEDHATADLDGSTLFVDHRFNVDATGGLGDITVTDGVLDIETINTTKSSIDFSTLPSEETFKISYTATTDKVQDSHLNVLQNAMMQMQQKLGLQNAVDGVGTGLTTLPIVTTFDPAEQSSIDQIKQTILPNMVMLGHLEADTKIGSTSNPVLGSFGGDGFTITLGNDAAAGSMDHLRFFGQTLQVENKDGLPGSFYYSMNTGDQFHCSGIAEFASQVTIGRRHGGAGVQLGNSSFMFPGEIPGGLSGFYNNALLRVNGSIYVGNGMSGIGGFTFLITSGEVFDIVGNLEATDLLVENTSSFHGPAAFRDRTNASYPGFFTTNNDIELRDRPGGAPGRIDDLDPSYANTVIHSPSQLLGVVSTQLRDQVFDTVYEQPWASGAKQHPIHKFHMYPMMGGFSFSGTVQFAKAASFSNKNVLIVETALQRIGAGANEYGSFSQGMFTAGDTHIEIDNGGGDRLSYPIYYHDRVIDDGAAHAIVTGLNLYVATDDDVLISPTVNGQAFRIFQPSNVPVKHLSVDFGTPTSPTVTFGNAGGSLYYGVGAQHAVEFTTNAAWPGSSASPVSAPIYKKLLPGEAVTTNILTALQRSVDKEELDAFVAWAATGDQIGVAYILASTTSSADTLHGSVQLKASPSPFGIAARNVWNSAGTKINPGQWTPVGEVVATTTVANQGNSWSLTEVVSYRPNAFYDSCWVPLVTYRAEGMNAGGAQTIPLNLGRCLPFHTSADHGSNDNVFAPGEGDHNFFVEHNIGPVVSLEEVSLRVFVAKFGTNADGSTYNRSTNNERFTAFRDSAAGVANLWTQYPMPYQANNHDFFDGPIGSRVAGGIKEVTAETQIRFFDSRFARISFIDTGNVLIGNKPPDYIRVVIKRTR